MDAPMLVLVVMVQTRSAILADLYARDVIQRLRHPGA